MHFRIEGEGPALLLIHAFPYDGRLWDAQVDELSATHSVIVPDLPGFGRSPRPVGNPSLDDWADALVRHCRGFGVERAIVSGCSIGGYIAFAMLRQHSDFVAGLAFVDSRAGADSQDARRARYEMVERARHEGSAFLKDVDPPVSPVTKRDRPQVVEAVRAMMADASPVGVMVAQRAMASRPDSQSLLAGIRVPTTVMRGDDDPIIPRGESEALAASIPGATFVPIPDAGHLPPIEQPAAVNAALRALLTRVNL